MLKLKKNFTFLFIISLISLLIPSNLVLANETNDIANEQVSALYSIFENDGSVTYFANKSDYEYYIANFKTPKTRAPGDYGHTVRSSVISTKKTKMQWIGYLNSTKNWIKASSYTLKEDFKYSVSGSYTYSGFLVSIGFSYTNGIAITIPANKKKYSRLGVWGDFTYKKMKYQDYYYNVKKGKPRYGVTVTRTAKYIKPKYK